jgi:hypothetical protein
MPTRENTISGRSPIGNCGTPVGTVVVVEVEVLVVPVEVDVLVVPEVEVLEVVPVLVLEVVPVLVVPVELEVDVLVLPVEVELEMLVVLVEVDGLLEVEVLVLVLEEEVEVLVVLVEVELLVEVEVEMEPKSAVMVPGPFIVAVVELDVPLVNAIDAPPLDQLEKVYPPLAVAEMESPVPAA